MYRNNSGKLSVFFIAGINYKKTDATIRGHFAVNNDQYNAILKKAPGYNIHECFILSTCNRTEIYGFATDADQLIDLLCSETKSDAKTFRELAYIKKGVNAVEHLFMVAAGLDSQILGDYEIVGQLKKAVSFARKYSFTGTFTERLVNCVLQSSKKIKNNTLLSSGTVSISFAAIQYVKENIKNLEEKRILLIGTGKIGSNTCRNLVDYLGLNKITLVNRTHQKASCLAGEMCLKSAPIGELSNLIKESDIIICAANASNPFIMKEHFLETGKKLVIDLSVPYNVEASVREFQNVHLVNVDELSLINDETLQIRKAEIPKAIAIIAQYEREFMEWYEDRKHVPVLLAIKEKLNEIHTDPAMLHFNTCTKISASDKKIQRVISGTASKMKVNNLPGCHYIAAINEFIATGSH